jgi:hypothetical protein
MKERANLDAVEKSGEGGGPFSPEMKPAPDIFYRDPLRLVTLLFDITGEEFGDFNILNHRLTHRWRSPLCRVCEETCNQQADQDTDTTSSIPESLPAPDAWVVSLSGFWVRY